MQVKIWCRIFFNPRINNIIYRYIRIQQMIIRHQLLLIFYPRVSLYRRSGSSSLPGCPRWSDCMTRPSTPNSSGQWDLSQSGQYQFNLNQNHLMMEFILHIEVISLVAWIHVHVFKIVSTEIKPSMWMNLVFQDEVVAFEYYFILLIKFLIFFFQWW